MAIEKFDPSQINWLVEFTILGQTYSKENSRRMVTNKKTGKLFPIKSKGALSFLEAAKLQCPVLDPLLEGDLIIACEIFYPSRRQDLDESLVLDALQNKIYTNDRQIKEKHIYWNLDKINPRITIKIAEKILTTPP